MVSSFSSTPILHDDGSISAVVRDIQPVPPAGHLLRLWLPIPFHAGGGFGSYFLARCADDTPEARRSDWSIYNRRPLFAAAMPVAMPEQAGSSFPLFSAMGSQREPKNRGTLWQLLVPASVPLFSAMEAENNGTDDPGHTWLVHRPIDAAINLLGPFGQLFELAAHTRALLVLADTQTLPLVLPVVHAMLDQGGRVTLLIQGQAELAASLLPLIPIPVEARIVPAQNWLEYLTEPVRWADQLCAALPNRQYADLAHRVRTLRFQLDRSFAHMLVESQLICGVGACLACVVTTRDGSYTRACIHGPVFPLAAIVS